DFIKRSTLITTGISLSSGAGWTNKLFGPNDRVNVGLIGCRNQGFYVLKEFLKTGHINCLGLCDIDQNILDEKRVEVKRDFQQTPKTYGDFRKMLEDKTIDAVIVATPDHWHCLQTVYLCQAGKDVYVEKPLANSIGECIIMEKAARKYGRVVQVGQQQRSSPVWNGIMEYIKSGRLGATRKVNIWANFNYGTGALKQADQTVPKHVDFELWLGPAPRRSFNPSRFHGNWRHFWDYGGGLMTDWGVHLLDMALWVKDHTSDPKMILSYGENLAFKEHSRETFDTMSVVFPMDEYVINWQHAAGIQNGPYDMPYGVEFIGEKASIVANRDNWEIKLENKKDSEQARVEAAAFKQKSEFSDVGNHVINFIECIRTRKAPNCSVEKGRNVALYAHMANIAARSEAGKLVWDEKSQSFENNKEANALISPQYRKPWELTLI